MKKRKTTRVAKNISYPNQIRPKSAELRKKTPSKKLLFEEGEFNLAAGGGWKVGYFAEGPVSKTGKLEVKLASHAPGPVGKGWSKCRSSITLSVLISGHFKMEFHAFHKGPIKVVDLHIPGQFVMFGPDFCHQSIAFKDSLFLTVRWPSKVGNCEKLSDEELLELGIK